jgi:hypothetical protein
MHSQISQELLVVESDLSCDVVEGMGYSAFFNMISMYPIATRNSAGVNQEMESTWSTHV